MEIEVTVPSLLSGCTGGRTRFTFTPHTFTLDGALHDLFTAYPLLRRHVCDERDRIRKHVLIFHNEERVMRVDVAGVALHSGDQLQVLQNVSGG